MARGTFIHLFLFQDQIEHCLQQQHLYCNSWSVGGTLQKKMWLLDHASSKTEEGLKAPCWDLEDF